MLGVGTAAAPHLLSCAPGTGDAQDDASTDVVPVHYRSIRDVARLIERGEISSLELTRALLERIDALDDRLRSYATVVPERALAAARAADAEIAGRHLSRSSPRSAGCGQGSVLHAGCADHGWAGRAGRLPAGIRRDRRRAAPGSGRRDSRKAQPHRGSHGGLSPRLRDSGEPVGPGALARRLLERLGCRNGRRPLLRVTRFGHRRFDPIPRRRSAVSSVSSRRGVVSADTAFSSWPGPWTTSDR